MGLDLADIGTPRLSLRRAVNLIRRLPHWSHLGQAHGGSDWSRTDALLNLLLYTTRAANWSGKGDKPKPFPMDPKERPPGGKKRRRRRRITNAKARELLAAWRSGEPPPSE